VVKGRRLEARRCTTVEEVGRLVGSVREEDEAEGWMTRRMSGWARREVK
jgi:hypothetical protein